MKNTVKFTKPNGQTDKYEITRDTFDEKKITIKRVPNSGSGVGLLELAGSLVVSILALTAIVASAALVLLYSVLKTWPDVIMQLVDAFAVGAVDFSVILAAAALVFLAAYFILSVCLVVVRKQMRSRNFLIVCAAVLTVLYSVFPLLVGRFNPVQIVINALYSLTMAALPAFILCFVEHLATKRLRGDPEWFLTKVSRLVSRVFPGHETGMLIGGVLVVLAGMFMNGVSKVTEAEAVSGVPGPTAVIVLGAAILLMSVFARKAR